jgi:hypothetical protein
MPSCVRSFNIVKGCPNPDGTSATMYITCTPSHNNQAQWSTQDSDVTYSVTLPSNAWTPPTGGSLTFSVVKGTPSGIYTIKSNAPNGESDYAISPACTTAEPPSVMIDS